MDVGVPALAMKRTRVKVGQQGQRGQKQYPVKSHEESSGVMWSRKCATVAVPGRSPKRAFQRKERGP